MIRIGGRPQSRTAWYGTTLALTTATYLNAAIFIALGTAADVQSNLPMPIMALLTIPAIGLVPWLMVRLEQQYAALILSAFVVFAAKIAGCLAARIVYGPGFISNGYVAGDWGTAKLMITVFWSLTSTISLGLLWAGYLRSRPDDHFSRESRQGDAVL